jgi:SAM-dependent methyltransferase
MNWNEAFADRCDEWASGMSADIPFYVDLAGRSGGSLVELAVGSGRVAIPVARSTGRPVIGFDISARMLDMARRRAMETGVELQLHEVDMRELSLDRPAGLIYCPGRSLFHLPTWADRRVVFERVAASLEPGGTFAWNAFVFDHRVAVKLDGSRHDLPVPHTMRYVAGDNRVELVCDDGVVVSMWWATKNEWLGLIDVAGLELDCLYGGFAGEPFTDDSGEYVFVARRPAR